MKRKAVVYPLVIILVCLITFPGCLFKRNDPEYPEVTTNFVTDITQTTATSGGVIISDGDADITEKGVCWSQYYPPYSYESHTVDGTGDGSFTSYITGLTPNTLYYVRAYATNEVGTSYGESQSFTTGNTGGGGGTVTDIDGNTYNTVTIGSQVWMAENLKVTHYRNGDEIPYVSDGVAWSNLTTGGYCYYDNLISNGDTYGKLYNWAAVNDSRNIAPAGWHVPTFDEWLTLMNTLGGSSEAGGKLKETGTTHWNSPNNASNDVGFTALGTGLRDQTGTYFGMWYVTYFWSSTVGDPTYAWGVSITSDATTLNTAVFEKPLGFPIRCVKD